MSSKKPYQRGNFSPTVEAFLKQRSGNHWINPYGLTLDEYMAMFKREKKIERLSLENKEALVYKALELCSGNRAATKKLYEIVPDECKENLSSLMEGRSYNSEHFASIMELVFSVD